MERLELYLSDRLTDNVGTNQLGCGSEARCQQRVPCRSTVALHCVTGQERSFGRAVQPHEVVVLFHIDMDLALFPQQNLAYMTELKTVSDRKVLCVGREGRQPLGRHVAVLLHGMIHDYDVSRRVLRFNHGADEILQVAEGFWVLVPVAVDHQCSFIFARSGTWFRVHVESSSCQANEQNQQALSGRPTVQVHFRLMHMSRATVLL